MARKYYFSHYSEARVLALRFKDSSEPGRYLDAHVGFLNQNYDVDRMKEFARNFGLGWEEH